MHRTVSFYSRMSEDTPLFSSSIVAPPCTHTHTPFTIRGSEQGGGGNPGQRHAVNMPHPPAPDSLCSIDSHARFHLGLDHKEVRCCRECTATAASLHIFPANNLTSLHMQRWKIWVRIALIIFEHLIWIPHPVSVVCWMLRFCWINITGTLVAVLKLL